MKDAARGSSVRAFTQPKMAALIFLGFASGLPFNLIGNGKAFQAWMTASGVNLTTIGLFSMVGSPVLAEVSLGAGPRSLHSADSRSQPRMAAHHADPAARGYRGDVVSRSKDRPPGARPQRDSDRGLQRVAGHRRRCLSHRRARGPRARRRRSDLGAGLSRRAASHRIAGFHARRPSLVGNRVRASVGAHARRNSRDVPRAGAQAQGRCRRDLSEKLSRCRFATSFSARAPAWALAS